MSPVARRADVAGRPSRPKLCFLTTGTGDRRSSIDGFYAAFADSGVDTSHLALFDQPNVPDVTAHLLGQDMIWVDRGSAVNLLAVWRAHELDRILRECWQRGVVLCGESAGSLCWHAGGTTDSFGEVRPLRDGLGFLPCSNAVHYGERRELFRRCIASGELPEGYATDAGAALHYEGTDLVAAVADRKNARAYRVKRNAADGGVTESPLDVTYLAG